LFRWGVVELLTVGRGPPPQGNRPQLRPLPCKLWKSAPPSPNCRAMGPCPSTMLLARRTVYDARSAVAQHLNFPPLRRFTFEAAVLSPRRTHRRRASYLSAARADSACTNCNTDVKIFEPLCRMGLPNRAPERWHRPLRPASAKKKRNPRGRYELLPPPV